MTLSANSISPQIRSEVRRGTPRSGNLIFSLFLWGSGLLSVLAMVAVIAVLLIGSKPALLQVSLFAFVVGLDWYPTAGEFGLFPMILGTVLTSVGAILVAGPLGILCAIYVHYYAGKIPGTAFRLTLQTLACIPSVVYGLWGLTVLVPFIASYRPPGASLLAGILVLSIMIVPTVTVLAEAGFRQLTPSYYLGGLALGCPRPVAIARVVLPALRGPLLVAFVLGLARAFGETMAVLMVTGNAITLPKGVFEPVRTLPSNIALEMAYAMDIHRSALFVSGLVLMGVVLLLLAASWKDPRP